MGSLTVALIPSAFQTSNSVAVNLQNIMISHRHYLSFELYESNAVAKN